MEETARRYNPVDVENMIRDYTRLLQENRKLTEENQQLNEEIQRLRWAATAHD